MPLPASFNTVTIVGTWIDFDGQPGVGTVTFTPSPDAYLKVTDVDVMVVPKSRQVTLDASGQISVVLPYTNDPDVVPQFKYSVVEAISGTKRSYDIEVLVSLGDGPIDLSDIAPAGTVTAGTTALTKTVADTLYEPLGGGGGGVPLTSYVDQVETLSDYPSSFPPVIGPAADEAVAGNDARLTNQRTPVDGSVSSPKLDATLTASITKANASLNQAEVDARVELIVGAAPGTLDTLVELAAAINNDPNFYTTLQTALSGKEPLSRDVVVEYLSTGWPSLPAKQSWQNYLFQSFRPADGDSITEAALIAAPQPTMSTWDSWDPHPESTVYTTLGS